MLANNKMFTHQDIIRTNIKKLHTLLLLGIYVCEHDIQNGDIIVVDAASLSKTVHI